MQLQVMGRQVGPKQSRHDATGFDIATRPTVPAGPIKGRGLAYVPGSSYRSLGIGKFTLNLAHQNLNLFRSNFVSVQLPPLRPPEPLAGGRNETEGE